MVSSLNLGKTAVQYMGVEIQGRFEKCSISCKAGKINCLADSQIKPVHMGECVCLPSCVGFYSIVRLLQYGYGSSWCIVSLCHIG